MIEDLICMHKIIFKNREVLRFIALYGVKPIQKNCRKLPILTAWDKSN